MTPHPPSDAAASREPAESTSDPRATAWERFQEGAAAPMLGWRFLKQRPALWRYAVAPLIANLLITGLVLLLLILTALWFLSVVHPWFQQEGEWPVWLRWTAEILLGAVMVIASVGTALLLWKLLTGILCGYFYGLLAKEVEIMLGVAPEELKDLSFLYQVIDTVYDLAALIATHAVFLVVGLFPLVGGPLALVGDFSVTWYIFGRDYLDYPLAMRGMRRREKSRYCLDRLPHTLGLGATVFVMSFVPIIGSVFLTTAAVGAVLLHRRLP
ncbi:MAG: EI24 domain-containing protein [Planctomycetes bacterium]|nr:EI24 domain-containing protein [Planctomycetota bacterium]